MGHVSFVERKAVRRATQKNVITSYYNVKGIRKKTEKKYLFTKQSGKQTIETM
jgi:hypothetical protein